MKYIVFLFLASCAHASSQKIRTSTYSVDSEPMLVGKKVCTFNEIKTKGQDNAQFIILCD